MWARGPLWDHLGLVLVLGWVVTCLLLEWPVLLTGIEEAGQRAVFQTLATVSGTMAGLTFTSISIMINLVRTPMSTIDRLTRPEEKRQVGDVFIGVLPRLLLAFSFSIVALSTIGADGDASMWGQGIALWFALASISALARVVWVLRRLLKLA